jgi:hypothetical protein
MKKSLLLTSVFCFGLSAAAQYAPADSVKQILQVQEALLEFKQHRTNAAKTIVAGVVMTGIAYVIHQRTESKTNLGYYAGGGLLIFGLVDYHRAQKHLKP